MAKKTASKAEKTVQDSKKKASANASSKSSGKTPAAKKPPAVKKNPKVSTEYENPISSGVTGGIVCLFLFVLFVMILFKSEGALLLVTKSIVLDWWRRHRNRSNGYNLDSANGNPDTFVAHRNQENSQAFSL